MHAFDCLDETWPDFDNTRKGQPPSKAQSRAQSHLIHRFQMDIAMVVAAGQPVDLYVVYYLPFPVHLSVSDNSSSSLPRPGGQGANAARVGNSLKSQRFGRKLTGGIWHGARAGTDAAACREKLKVR